MSNEDKKLWTVLGVSDEAKIEAKRLAKLNKMKIGEFLESLIFNNKPHESDKLEDISGALHIIAAKVNIMADQIISLSLQMAQVSKFMDSMPNIYIGDNKPKTFWDLFSKKK